jgi:hypothetical protein
MSKKKKHEPIDGTAKARYALEPIPQFSAMCATAQKNIDGVQKCPKYANDKPVQDAVALVQTCITKLGSTLSTLDQAHVTIDTLEPQRVQDAAALHRANDTLETAVTNATGGVRQDIIAYAASVSAPTIAAPTTDAPTEVRGKSVPGSQSVSFWCKADKRAVCYHYRWGTDPTNPDAWTNSAVEGGAHHAVPGPLPIGQKLYFTIAIQRRRTGLGQWSGIVEIVVR